MTPADELVFREMTADDVEPACSLVKQFSPTLVDEAKSVFCADLAHRDLWPQERYRLVAESAGRVVGTMGYGRGAFPVNDVFWTDWLMVDIEWRRHGVASGIYRALESLMVKAGCRKVCLDVGTVYKQPDAVAFHAHHGYRIEGILQSYWGPGEDLVFMAKDF